MTENQEEEMFKTLSALVNGVNQIQVDVKDIKVTLGEHSQTLAEHSRTLADHSLILAGHSQTMAEHSRKLDHLIAKTDSIAEQVVKNDINFNTRVTVIEQAVENMGGKIH